MQLCCIFLFVPAAAKKLCTMTGDTMMDLLKDSSNSSMLIYFFVNIRPFGIDLYQSSSSVSGTFFTNDTPTTADKENSLIQIHMKQKKGLSCGKFNHMRIQVTLISQVRFINNSNFRL